MKMKTIIDFQNGQVENLSYLSDIDWSRMQLAVLQEKPSVIKVQLEDERRLPMNISIELDRNQARYLLKALEGFVEQENPNSSSSE